MDHGAERTIQTGGPLTNQVAVVFAGPHQKADPVIVALTRSALDTDTTSIDPSNTSHDVNDVDVVVVSSDNEVVQACKQQGATILDPVVFLQQLQAIDDDDVPQFWSNHHDKPNTGNQTTTVSALPWQPPHHDTLQREVAARQEVQMIDRLIHPRGTKKMSRKQRTKLVSRQLRAKERLTRVLEESAKLGMGTLQSVVHSHDSPDTTQDDLYVLDTFAQRVEEASPNSNSTRSSGNHVRETIVGRTFATASSKCWCRDATGHGIE